MQRSSAADDVGELQGRGRTRNHVALSLPIPLFCFPFEICLEFFKWALVKVELTIERSPKMVVRNWLGEVMGKRQIRAVVDFSERKGRERERESREKFCRDTYYLRYRRSKSLFWCYLSISSNRII